MTSHRVNLASFVLLLHTQLLNGQVFIRTDEAVLFAAGHGTKCTQGHDFLQEYCVAAALSVGGQLRNGNIILGDWLDTPPGCFLESSDKAIHFNTNIGGINDADFQPVCKPGLDEAALLQPGLGVQCKVGHDFSKADCVGAASSIGGTLHNGHLLGGEWSHAPYGCSVEGTDKSIHFGTDINGVNNGQFEPVCVKDLDDAILQPAISGSKCDPGYDFSQVDCPEAGLSIGGLLPQGIMRLGDWRFLPPGCSISGLNQAIHFNTHADGVNDGQFQSVCAAGDIKATFLPPGWDTKCTPDHGISQKDCVMAASSVGGILRDGKFLVDFWHHTPPGCFVQALDKAIHFNTNTASINNGNYQAVCVGEYIDAVLVAELYEGSKCGPALDFTQEECIAAASLVGGRLRTRKFLVDNWDHTPPGCFLQKIDRAIHFGTNVTSINNGEFQPVCKPAVIDASLVEASYDSKCRAGRNFNEKECVEAGTKVVGRLRQGKFLVGDWTNAPYGCFLDMSDNAIHYGRNQNGINNGNFLPVCTTNPLPAMLLPAENGNKCPIGDNFSKEECVAAAEQVGGRLRRGKYLVDNWTHTPPGCFLQRSDYAIHFGENTEGVNNGHFQPVCVGV